MADMVIDPVSSDGDSQGLLDENSSNIDPEDLRPYNQQDTAFTNSASFEYRNFSNIQRARLEESKSRPAFIQQRYKPPKINVELPDNHEERPRNELFGPS